MACRSFLLKLEQCGYITLPLSQKSPDNSLWNQSNPYVSHQRTAITGSLDTLAPVHVELVESTGLPGLFKCLLAWYHYLGFSGTVGENMKYMVFDREHNPLACRSLARRLGRVLPGMTLSAGMLIQEKQTLTF